MNSKTILCVEDNMAVQLFNKPLLEKAGYAVKLAMTLAEARQAVRREPPELILLDIHMTDGSGLDFLRELRRVSGIPVLLLTGLTTPRDVIQGFSEGGDDYLTKPYDFGVLLARIEALLRRAATVPDTLVRGTICMDITSRRASLDGEDLLLKPKAFDLLMYFIRNEGIYVSAETLYKKVWGQEMQNDDNAVKYQVSSLRKKLENSGYTISSQRGEGYCFEPV